MMQLILNKIENCEKNSEGVLYLNLGRCRILLETIIFTSKKYDD